MTIDINSLVEKYVSLRDGIDKLKTDFEAKKKPLEDAQDTIANYLMKIANDQGVSSFKTPAGTAFKQKVTRCSVENSDDFIDFVKTNNAYNMLPKQVNKTAVQEYIDLHEAPPPGVRFTALYEIQIRRS